MERREQYDPEDIESLLNERSFDELLEEERAYVLRHLTNRDEYETMRALLHQVRSDERSEGQITAPLEVREHVLNVFRQQQQPQWRVWLNSLGAILWPKEMSALWRPALALGSVALLITTGVYVFDRSSERDAQLAEVRPAKEVAEAGKGEAAAASEPAMDSVGGVLSSQLEQQDEASAPEQAKSLSTVQDGFAQGIAPTEGAADAEHISTTSTERATGSFDVISAAPVAESLEEKKAVVDDERLAKEELPAGVPHQVTEAELARNESFANATGVSTRETSRRKTEAFKVAVPNSRSLGDDAALVSLINSGW